MDKENGGIEVTIYDMLNELKAYKNLDVYVTGSNSKGLSKDIATEFRGRATQIHVFPLSFAEFYSAVGGDERKALDTYMLYGGMPRLLALEDEKDKKDYLTSLYSELYVKDIVERNGIEREDVLNDILDFLASQISSLTNPTNIANAIASMKNEKINPAMFQTMCSMLSTLSSFQWQSDTMSKERPISSIRTNTTIRMSGFGTHG